MSVPAALEKQMVEEIEEASAREAQETFTPAEERRLVRKLDVRILPWIMLLYMLSYLDRGNLGNSVILGIKKDLKLVGSEYEWAGAVFYCATFLFGTIGGLMLKIVKPSYYLAGCCFGWGGLAMAQAGAKNFAGLAAARFFLGFFEASFAPGCAFYLSFWYTRDELTLRIAAYAGTSALAGVLGGLISYGIGFIEHSALKKWQWLFIIEGAPTMLIGIATIWVLPDRPEQGTPRGFTNTEHEIVLARRRRYITGNADQKGINWSHVRAALIDYRLWLFAVIYSGLSLSLGVISIFLPSLLTVMGYKSYKANLMTAPPYAVGYFGLLICAWAAGRYRQRALFVLVPSLIGGIGYLIVGLAPVKQERLRYGGSFLVVAGTYWSFPVVLAWVANTFAADSKAGTGLGAVIAVTHAVGIAAAHIYPSSESPQYTKGSIVSAALMFLAAVGAVIMRILLKRDNDNRDRAAAGHGDMGAVVGDKADKDPNFRYVL